MRRADAGLILVLAATWGAVYPLTAVALRQVSPQDVVFVRTAAAALALIPFGIRGKVIEAVRKRWRDLLAATALQATIPLVLLTIGQQHVSASVAGIISGAQPVMVAFLAFAVPGARRPGRQAIAGITIGLAGIVLLFSDDLGTPGTGPLAGLAILGSAIFFALGAVWIDARLADVPPLGIATTAMCVTAMLGDVASGPVHHSMPARVRCQATNLTRGTCHELRNSPAAASSCTRNFSAYSPSESAAAQPQSRFTVLTCDNTGKRIRAMNTMSRVLDLTHVRSVYYRAPIALRGPRADG